MFRDKQEILAENLIERIKQLRLRFEALLSEGITNEQKAIILETLKSDDHAQSQVMQELEKANEEA